MIPQYFYLLFIGSQTDVRHEFVFGFHYPYW